MSLINISTPNKLRINLQPGNVAVSLKWKGTTVYEHLKGLFNSVKVQDLGDYDFCLPDENIIYLNESRLVAGVNTETLKALGAVTVIADRNIITVEYFSKVQLSLYPLGLSVLPVGHMNEIPLLLHQLSLAVIMQSPASTFRNSIKPPPDIQLQLLLNVPGLGRAKASKLLDVFGTVQRTAFASVEDLKPVVGVATADQVYRYFNGLVNS